MHSQKIVFLGGGRITLALLSGLRLAAYRDPIVVHDRNPHKLRTLKKEFRVAIEPDLFRAINQAHLLIVAVRPANMMDLLRQIRQTSEKEVSRRNRGAALACSLAAGIPLAQLRAGLGPFFRWSRAMPSPVARTGTGLTAVAFDRGFPKTGRALVTRFFRNVSTVVDVPESQFDAFTVTYSPSHGYHALQTLARASEQEGLDRKNSYIAAAHALADAIDAWRNGDELLEALLHEAATPGGIAATVMNSMDSSGYARLVRKALRAGIARARANARLR